MIFVSFDLGSFLVQLMGASAVGAAYSDKDLTAEVQEEKARSGLAALQLGLALQLICFGMFVLVGLRFLFVSRRWRGRPPPYAIRPGASWERLLWAVNTATTLITVRTLPERPQQL